MGPLNHGGGRGGGGRRAASALTASILIEVDIEHEPSGKRSEFQKMLAPLPFFLTHSTIEET